MNDYPAAVKEKLTSLITEMAASPAPFVKNPERDFTRKRKLPFETVVQLLISMGGNSIFKELLKEQGYDLNTATTSAFVQQRDKILPAAFEFLFHAFTETFHALKTYQGYRLLATDGSDLHIAIDPGDHDTYFQSKLGEKGYNLLHLNAIYDLYNRLYVDACVQPRRYENENRALVDMVQRSSIKDNVIILADRGFESYNNFAHIERKGWNYVIRIRDVGSNGILSGLPLPATSEFDMCVRRILTRKRTKEVNAHPEVYRYLPSNSTFDFLDLQNNLFYPISFRVVRFRLSDDSYEAVITNLEQSEFPPQKLKELYNLRWGIETSFRELKYAVGLTNFHAKKREYIVQEIFARMIMYNFTEMITSHVIISQADTRYVYQINFTVAVLICKRFLQVRNNAPPPNVEALIRKNTLPVRPNRKDKRKIRSKTAVCFVYRVA